MPKTKIPKLTSKPIEIPSSDVQYGPTWGEAQGKPTDPPTGITFSTAVERSDITVDQESDTIETIITFDGKVYPLPEHHTLAKREDFHEDGSVSVTYYLDLTEEQYARYLAGRR